MDEIKKELIDAILEPHKNKINSNLLKIDPTDEEITFINKNARYSVRHEIVDAVITYENTQDKDALSVAEVPLFFVLVLGAERAIHLSLIILLHDSTSTQMYSIGLGYHGSNSRHDKKNDIVHDIADKTPQKIGQVLSENLKSGIVSLYTPDYLIEEKRKNRIVEIGILTSEHIRKLNENYISKATNLSSVFEINKDKELEISHNFLDVPDQTYFSLANDSKNWDNCTTFITRIFKNINCQGLPKNNVTPVIPSLCTTTPATSSSIINEAYKLYSKENTAKKLIDLITSKKIRSSSSRGRSRKKTICEGEGCTVSGGRKQKTRKKAN